MNTSAAKLGAIFLFWLGVGLIQIFNWGNGAPKAVVMLGMLVAMPFIMRAASKPVAPLAPGFARGIGIAVWIALALDLAFLAARLVAPHVIDIATSTLAAGQALLHGMNPYSISIDAGPESAGFTGYKYLPVMIVAYLPLGAPLGQRGVLITNLIIWLAALALMRRLAGGRLAPLLLVMLPLVTEQAFAKGATDLLAVLPLLGALALVGRSSFWCGMCAGLSIAAKLLPGVAVLPALIPGERRVAFVAGVAVGLLPMIPFVIVGPRAFWDNIVLFNLTRLPDDTSWLHFMPPAVASAAHLALAVGMLAAAVAVWRRPPSVATRAGLAAMLGIGSILAGPGAHHNYQLWWLPFYGVALSLALAPARNFGYTTGAEITAKGV